MLEVVDGAGVDGGSTVVDPLAVPSSAEPPHPVSRAVMSSAIEVSVNQRLSSTPIPCPASVGSSFDTIWRRALTEYDVRRIFRAVVLIDGRDAASLLEIVHNGAWDDGVDPFPRRVLVDLARLIPSDACVGYQDAEVADHFRVVELVEVVGTPPSPETERALHTLGWQNPMHCRLHVRQQGVLRLSDFLTRRQRLQLEYNDMVWRPHGIDDALRIWLPAPSGRARSVYLERGRRNYTERERALFGLLRPHLGRMRLNAEARRRVGSNRGLTPREAEVLGWVARGKTNAEIGAALFISPQTVRKHLENIFEKLGVRTRTAAAAFARAALRAGERTSGNGIDAGSPREPHDRDAGGTRGSRTPTPRSSAQGVQEPVPVLGEG